jgi:transcriptional regulator with XRE-family HTH domain
MDTKNLKRQLGYRLKELRAAKGMRQEDLEELGFSYRYYGKMERGLVNPTIETLMRLCEIFEIDLVDLFLLMKPGELASEEREAVVLKVSQVLKGSNRKIKKLKIFLEEIL